jgi:Protein of unknown function (DUF1524)
LSVTDAGEWASAYRIRLGGADNAFLFEYVLRSGATQSPVEDLAQLDESQQAILKVRGNFVTELSNLSSEDRERLKDYVLERCHVVAIVTMDIDHGHRMFTVLNDRGRPLARKDIIKAEILSDIPEDRSEAILARWCEAERQLGGEFDTFFSHLRTIRGKGKMAIIAGVRSAATEAGGSERFVADVLLPLADAFDLIRRASHEGAPQSPALSRRLAYLSWLGGSEWVPSAMLWLSRHRDSPADMLRFLELIDRFAYSLRLLCIGAGKRTARFSAVLPAINRGTLFDADRSPCTLSREEQRHICYNLRNLHERHPQTCKLVLLRLNDELAGKAQNLDPAEWTVEHVLPQSPGRTSQWRTWFPESDERDRLTQSLGNLVLIRRSQNDRASNQDFDRKKAIYFAGGGETMPAVTRDIEMASEWKPEQIRAREERFLAELGRLWGLDLSAVTSANGSELRRGARRERQQSAV